MVKASVTAYMDTMVVAMGLTEGEARKRGYDVTIAFVEANTKPRYMGGGAKILLKLLSIVLQVDCWEHKQLAMRQPSST